MSLRGIVVLGLWVCLLQSVWGNPVFRVEHKFKGKEVSLKDLRAHDTRRHGRLLSNIDLPLGGNGNPSDTGFVLLDFFLWDCVVLFDDWLFVLVIESVAYS